MSSQVRPAISFIIPVRNDAARLKRCVESVMHNGTDGSVEVIVVDNGSTDGSADAAAAAGAIVLTRTQGRVAELRNFAAAQATGHVLAFVDADHTIVPTWTAAALTALQQPGVGATGALCLAPADGTWVQRGYGYLRGIPAGTHDVEWLGSGNLAVPRAVFDQVGGFDTSLEACEDVDLCNRIRGRGFRIVSDASMENIHYGDPDTLRHLFRSELWRGRDNLRVSLRGPLTLRALPSVVIPIVVCVAFVVAVMGLVAAVFGYSLGIGVAAAALLLVATGASLRVLKAIERQQMTFAAIVATFAVACVYDAARALALLTKAPHRRQPPPGVLPAV